MSLIEFAKAPFACRIPGSAVKICGLTCVDEARGMRRRWCRLDRTQFSSGVAALH